MTRALPAVLALLAACAGAPARFDYAREPDPRKLEYVIGVPDHLAINVWKNPELTREVVVRPDGTITLPLVGDIRADGRTPTQLRDEIVTRLGEFVRGDLNVTVAVTGVNSYAFTVSGNFERPGVYSSQKYMTILEAVQLAGGPNRFASPAKMELIRRTPDGRRRTIPIDYPGLIEGKRLESNLALMTGDQLHLP